MMKIKNFLFALCFLFTLTSLSAQKLQGGLSLGASNYEGDVNELAIFALQETNPSFGAFLRYNATEVFALRGNFITGKLTGDDSNFDDPAWRQQRNFSFETPFSEISLLGEVDLFGKRRWKDGQFNKMISPYLFAGLGAVIYKPTVDFTENQLTQYDDEIRMDQEDNGGTSFTIPFGAGLKFDINRKVQLGAEIGFRPAFHDYLDGISLSANPDRNDWYVNGGLTLGVRFGKQDTDKDGIADEDDACPEVFGVEGCNGCPDGDMDGVADKEDACPTEAGDKKLGGCPDTDMDGVADKDDLCPDVPGMRRLNGCPDTDGDGVTDQADACPKVAGLKELDGCPDTDRDGVEDKADNCPEVKGVKALNGCPDADGDGITDADDACPNKAGTSKFGGCADSDGDGIADPKDKCPQTAGPSTNEGCPIITKNDATDLALAAKNIQFRFNSADIRTESYTDLDKIADILNIYSEYKVNIEGYTDSRGNAIANQNLSETRARACYNYLASKGISKARMSYKGFGEAKPIGDNNTDEGRQMNRRVEFGLYK